MTKLRLINENKRLKEENKRLKEQLEILSNAYIDLEGGDAKWNEKSVVTLTKNFR